MRFAKIFAIIIIAVLLAAAGYVAIQYITGRNQAPVENATVTTDGVPVEVQPSDPNAAQLQSEAQAQEAQPQDPQPQEAQPSVPDAEVQLPTNTPVPAPIPAPTNTPVPEPVPDAELTPPAPLPTVPQIRTVEYVVVADDNLFRIADKLNTRVSLMADYGISSTSVVPGVVLQVPVANPDYCAGRTSHVVGEGETVATIANQYGVTAASIAALNGLDATYRVQFNTVLCIP